MSLTRRCINPVSPGWARYFDSDPPWSSPSRVAFGGPNLIWSNLSYRRQDNFAGSKIGRALASRARQGPRQGRRGSTYPKNRSPDTAPQKAGCPHLGAGLSKCSEGTSRQLLLRCPNFLYLTARDGGNAEGLLGTIPALQVARRGSTSATAPATAPALL